LGIRSALRSPLFIQDGWASPKEVLLMQLQWILTFSKTAGSDSADFAENTCRWVDVETLPY
jgi:hypothetical protein